MSKTTDEFVTGITYAMYGTAVVVVLLVTLAFCTMAKAQQNSFWDKNGHFSGSSIRHDQGAGNRGTSFYGRDGHFSGSASTSGNTTTFYDKNGHYQGSVTNTSPRR